MIILRGDFGLLTAEDGLQFIERPREVVAVIVQAVVGVLAGVESSLGIGKDLFDKGKDAQGDLAEEFLLGYLIPAQVVHQQAGIVIGHFLEVGDDPAFVHGVAMESPADLVINTAPAHGLESFAHDQEQVVLAGIDIRIQQKIDGARMRKLRLVAEAAVLGIEHPLEALDDAPHDHGAGLLTVGLEFLDPAQCLADPVGARENVRFVSPVAVGDAFEHAPHAGAAIIVIRGKIGPSVKWLTVRSQKGRERPAALPGQRAHCHLIPRIDIRPFITVNLHRNIILVNDARNLFVLVALAVHDVAPMTPHRADIEQDGLILLACRLERLVVPFAPLDGLMRGAAQIGASGASQTVGGLRVIHDHSLADGGNPALGLSATVFVSAAKTGNPRGLNPTGRLGCVSPSRDRKSCYWTAGGGSSSASPGASSSGLRPAKPSSIP